MLSWFTTLSAFLVQLSGVLVYLSAVWVHFVWILSSATPHGGFTKLAVTHEPKISRPDLSTKLPIKMSFFD